MSNRAGWGARSAAIVALLTLAAVAQRLEAQVPVVAPPASAATRVLGTVYDSLASLPLGGAVVQMSLAAGAGTMYTTTSAANGEYHFDAVASGTYLITFVHPRLDSLDIEAPILRVPIAGGEALRIPLSIPSGPAMLRRLCGRPTRGDSLGLFMGVIRAASNGGAAPKANVRAQWAEFSVGPLGLVRRAPLLRAVAGDLGGFFICGVPRQASISVRAWRGTDSSGAVDLTIPPNGVLVRDLYVGQSVRDSMPLMLDATTSADSVAKIRVLRGQAVLRGVVRNQDGRALPLARVTLWGTGVDVRTASNGTFAMRALPGGTYTLEARALGYLPRRMAVDALEGEGRSEEIVLEPMGRALDTVRVKATRPFDQPLADFDRRRAGGLGTFIDEQTIRNRNPLYVADLFRGINGTYVEAGQSSAYAILMKGNSVNDRCIPALFLDGRRVNSTDGNLENVVSPTQIRGVEIYARTVTIPAEFSTMDGCGSVVIWTGRSR